MAAAGPFDWSMDADTYQVTNDKNSMPAFGEKMRGSQSLSSLRRQRAKWTKRALWLRTRWVNLCGELENEEQQCDDWNSAELAKEAGADVNTAECEVRQCDDLNNAEFSKEAGDDVNNADSEERECEDLNSTEFVNEAGAATSKEKAPWSMGDVEAMVHGKLGECRRALLLEVSEACEAVFVQPKHLEKLYGRLGDLHEKVDVELKAVKRRTAAVEHSAKGDALAFVRLEVEVERLDNKVREIEAHAMHCSRDESEPKEHVAVDAAEEAKKYLARFRSSLRPGMPVHIDGIGGLAAGWVNGAAGVVGQYDAGQNQWLVTLGEKDVWIRESFLQP